MSWKTTNGIKMSVNVLYHTEKDQGKLCTPWGPKIKIGGKISNPFGQQTCSIIIKKRNVFVQNWKNEQLPLDLTQNMDNFIFSSYFLSLYILHIYYVLQY